VTVVRDNVTLSRGDLAPAPPASAARAKLRAAVEATAAGLAVSATLCWLGACAVASFRPYLLFLPYWWAVPWLRTDTCGAIAFVLTAVCLVVSKYLRLSRLPETGPQPWIPRLAGGTAPRTFRGSAAVAGAGMRLVVAGCETAAILSTAIVVYLSVNAVTHPRTLAIQATHFASWPTEGTLRVFGLVVCAVSVGVLRFVRATSATPGRASQPAPGP
jgi:hypothetical protein